VKPVLLDSFSSPVLRAADECSPWIVITTNVGWTKGTGDAVMGRGLAFLAARWIPALPRLYGWWCRTNGSKPMHVAAIDNASRLVGFQRNLILLPTKALNRAAPHLSWQARSSLPLIEAGLVYLAEIVKPGGGAVGIVHNHVADDAKLPPHGLPIWVPPLGCRNGGLDEADVLPLMEKYLTDERFTLLRVAKEAT
jgi:hypothetical protein